MSVSERGNLRVGNCVGMSDREGAWKVGWKTASVLSGWKWLGS